MANWLHAKATRGDLERFERTDVAFHELATVTRNPIYAAVHDGLVEWLTSQRTISLQVAGAEDAALEGHRQVFESVARREAEAAARAMEDHLRSVTEFIGRAMEATMPELAVLGEFVVQPDFMPWFRRLIRANARKSSSNEVGCRRFDVLVQEDDARRIVLYEPYKSFAAAIAGYVEKPIVRRLALLAAD